MKRHLGTDWIADLSKPYVNSELIVEIEWLPRQSVTKQQALNPRRKVARAELKKPPSMSQPTSLPTWQANHSDSRLLRAMGISPT